MNNQPKYVDKYGNRATANDLGYIDGLNGYLFNPMKVTPEDQPDYQKGFDEARDQIDCRR